MRTINVGPTAAFHYYDEDILDDTLILSVSIGRCLRVYIAIG